MEGGRAFLYCTSVGKLEKFRADFHKHPARKSTIILFVSFASTNLRTHGTELKETK